MRALNLIPSEKKLSVLGLGAISAKSKVGRRHDPRLDCVRCPTRIPFVRPERRWAACGRSEGVSCQGCQQQDRVRPVQRLFRYQGADIKAWLEAFKAGIDTGAILTHARDAPHQDHREIYQLTWNPFSDHLILEYEIPTSSSCSSRTSQPNGPRMVQSGAPSWFGAPAGNGTPCAGTLRPSIRRAETQFGHWSCPSLILSRRRLRSPRQPS
jgi:LmbE family N-acetylglucosaminyl deacetylase